MVDVKARSRGVHSFWIIAYMSFDVDYVCCFIVATYIDYIVG